MRWILGIDLEHPHSAAAAFARWLDASHTFVAAHHVERALLRMADHDVVEQVREGAATALRTAVTREGLPMQVETVLAEGRSAEDALTELARQREADAIVVARSAATGADRLRHLGRVTRRLLRRLPTSVVVVPPELVTDGIGTGPVLLAADAHHDARRAAAFAAEIARTADRSVEMVHVYTKPFPSAVRRVPSAYVDGMLGRYREQQRERLERWLDTYDLAGPPINELEGQPAVRIAHFAQDRGACLVVCASRQLTTANRIFSSSVGSQLASIAAVPVAVVGSI